MHLQVTAAKPTAARNVWQVTVERTSFQGDFTQTNVKWGDQRLVVRAAGSEPLAEGSTAWLSVEPRRVVLLEE